MKKSPPTTMRIYTTNLPYKPTLKVSLGELQEDIIVSQNKSIELTAVNMYENPIICDSVYEFNGKKVGYLAYTGFDLKSINPLIEIGKKFKAEGIEELVLDLRYNGGGYVITENVLASMFAPQEAVSSKKVFEKEIYNSYLSESYQKQGESLETATRNKEKVWKPVSPPNSITRKWKSMQALKMPTSD